MLGVILDVSLLVVWKHAKYVDATSTNSERCTFSLSRILCYDMSVASSTASPPNSAIKCFPFQVPVSSRVLKVIQ
jgi:hypothetical protein